MGRIGLVEPRMVLQLTALVLVQVACEKPAQWEWDASTSGPNVERKDASAGTGGGGDTPGSMIGADGALYISDDNKGFVYRVAYGK